MIRPLVASEKTLFAGSLTKPKPVLEAAFRRAHLTPAFLKALPGRNPLDEERASALVKEITRNRKFG